MNDFVIADTNIISYIFKKDTRGNLYKPHLEGKVAIIAAQTLAELELLPLQNNWSKKRHDELRENLKNYTFIEANQEICLKWAKIRFEAKRNGMPVSVGDAWIAATALAYSIPLVTHNYSDFKNISGLQIITEK
ncbi:MAG: PIN domain-containing protein [Acidobacteria bacterium]|jgi:predicted nucleic acid-binding protein|nr:PIN domain-containing protein [Acidobacteriota bacterium]HEV8157924.1 PIN domain-containing protein [Pyrinomonadaceae bacterium]